MKFELNNQYSENFSERNKKNTMMELISMEFETDLNI